MPMDKQKLVEDNMNLVYYLINKYYPTFLHDDDVIQEGMLGLCQAASSYDSGRCKFSTFASVCILNRIRYYFRESAKYNSVTVSYDREIESEEEGAISFLDVIEGDEDVDLGLINFKMFYESLSVAEKHLMDLLVDHNENEIAKILGMSQPNVSRKKTALRNKWREFNGNN